MSIFIDGLEKWERAQTIEESPTRQKTKNLSAEHKAVSRVKNFYTSLKDAGDESLEYAGGPDLPPLPVQGEEKSRSGSPESQPLKKNTARQGSALKGKFRFTSGATPPAPGAIKPDSRFISREPQDTKVKVDPNLKTDSLRPKNQSTAVDVATKGEPEKQEVPDFNYLMAATSRHEREAAATQQQPESKDVVTRTDIKSRVEINLEWLKSLGMVTPDMSNARIVEEYRNIKRPILTKAFGTEGYLRNLVVVTSALQGEGKTFTSLNLALSVAMERDKHVLLVDADIEHGGMTKLLKLGQFVGLRDYLEDPKIQVDDLIVHSNIPSLSLISVGETHPDAAESLASSRMTHLLEELSARYPDRLIVLDASPLLVSSAASVVAQMADQRLIVFAADETPVELLDQLVTKLNDVEDTGIILNKAHPDASKGLYGYGHYGTSSDG